MPTPSASLALRQARQHLLESGRCPAGLLDERLARSWQRSADQGLKPTGRLGPPDNLEQHALRMLRGRHQQLLAHSRPIMEYLFEQVRDSQSVVVLSGPCGTLVDTCGDPYFLDKAGRVALTSGACWHEDQRGTNAIGTALAEMQPLQVRGGEHFLERNGFLTCSAAPILSGSGQLLGILDISSEHGRGSAHTLGLVSTAAHMIENRLLACESQGGMRLHLHAHPEGLGTVAEAIVLVAQDGWIVGANRSALALLRLDAGRIGGVALDQVLACGMEQLLARHRLRPDAPQALRTLEGLPLFCRLVPDRHTIGPVARPATVAVAAPEDALARLDTGDARWRAAASRARRVLDKPIALLIQGESGVGKEWFARASHDSGPRRAGPFVAINCAAIPEALIESELFGYEAGAFTGGRREGRRGLLRDADGGTLFLDEIGDMPLALQARLLRVLQERQVVPLGSGTPVAVDFALVCASNHALELAVEQGRFRADLYYRINGLALELPPLRERTDLEALCVRILDGIVPGQPVHLAPALLARLTAYHWPGNLRQCASVLRTACAMLDPGEDCIEWRHLPDDFQAQLHKSARLAPATPPAAPAQNLDELSRSAVRQALENCRGNISQAARMLGISRQTLYRKLARDRAP
ncbi:Acetoin catabolism regulatory protein [Delftia tsuruhatensis]|uniref:sigma-54-dependent Fis family transcriptional regulator n=1 Tax=Delftia tsuruhatensis TaxID=180282 RepID=UPI001E714C16|nr:sigma-54-dependent Fis family transcriptional regulator [Delftia tsuruhatensis]CAB5663446.1 Acetoin catabolism regulatory protein [Delftia tsuruhatensis]CAC9677318.1 Acetoin catabolism regulatory protein [Delftia tsuruhatensis]